RPILEKWCTENGYNLYADGLQIHTTIDNGMQMAAEKAVERHLVELQKLFVEEQGTFKFWYDKQIAKEKEEYKRSNPKVKELPLMPAEKTLQSLIQNSTYYKNLKAEGRTEEEIKRILSEPHKTRVLTHFGE